MKISKRHIQQNHNFPHSAINRSRQIPHNRPHLGEEEAVAVARVIKSNRLIAGREVERFEHTIKRFVQRNYAVAVNTGTAALHLSLLALGIKKGDEVITSTYTVADIINAICYTGATPVLTDTENGSANIDSQDAKRKITRKTKAIIVPHMLGIPAKIDAIQRLGIPVIEDCAQSLGSFYKNTPTGSFGTISIFSFYASKVITTGQGGMAVTNDRRLYKTMRNIIDYNGPDNYKIRYNYPLTDIHAAIGNMQFGKLEQFIRRRKHIASLYREILSKTSIGYYPDETMQQLNHFRFIVQFNDRRQRDDAQRLLAEQSISTITPYKRTELLHNLLHKNVEDFPHAETLAATTLSLPVFPSLSDAEVKRVARALRSLSLRTAPGPA